ncbi:MAG: hypothetical protein NT099_02295 [Candidatus Saganbacteria bacterium]|nr:hypothetical protein [Candidatus Saganbacteria bacterium]
MVPGILMPAIVYGGVKLVNKLVDAITGDSEPQKGKSAKGEGVAVDPKASGLWDSAQRAVLGMAVGAPSVIVDSVGQGLEDVGEKALGAARDLMGKF